MLNFDGRDCTEIVALKTYEKFCFSFVATAIVGSAVVGGAVQMYTSNKAVNAQTAAANRANQIAEDQYNTTRNDLQPYRDTGVNATNQLNARLPELTAPIVMDQAALEQTPGYQFTKTQGLKAVQNSAAARGLGSSGAALKGAANFATGLADNTYQTQFNIANTNQTNAFNRLKALVDTGESAAAQTGTFGQQAAQTVAGNTVGIGNAQAAADNKLGNTISNSANTLAGYAAFKGLYGGGNNNGTPAGAMPSAPVNYTDYNPTA